MTIIERDHFNREVRRIAFEDMGDDGQGYVSRYVVDGVDVLSRCPYYGPPRLASVRLAFDIATLRTAGIRLALWWEDGIRLAPSSDPIPEGPPSAWEMQCA